LVLEGPEKNKSREDRPSILENHSFSDLRIGRLQQAGRGELDFSVRTKQKSRGRTGRERLFPEEKNKSLELICKDEFFISDSRCPAETEQTVPAE